MVCVAGGFLANRGSPNDDSSSPARDPVSKSNVESNRGRHVTPASGFHVRTLAQVGTPVFTRVHVHREMFNCAQILDHIMNKAQGLTLVLSFKLFTFTEKWETPEGYTWGYGSEGT